MSFLEGSVCFPSFSFAWVTQDLNICSRLRLRSIEFFVLANFTPSHRRPISSPLFLARKKWCKKFLRNEPGRVVIYWFMNSIMVDQIDPSEESRSNGAKILVKRPTNLASYFWIKPSLLLLIVIIKCASVISFLISYSFIYFKLCSSSRMNLRDRFSGMTSSFMEAVRAHYLRKNITVYDMICWIQKLDRWTCTICSKDRCSSVEQLVFLLCWRFYNSGELSSTQNIMHRLTLVFLGLVFCHYSFNGFAVLFNHIYKSAYFFSVGKYNELSVSVLGFYSGCFFSYCMTPNSCFADNLEKNQLQHFFLVENYLVSGMPGYVAIFRSKISFIGETNLGPRSSYLALSF